MKKIPYFDGHCDTVYRCFNTKESLLQNMGHVALDRVGGFSAYAQIFALFWDAAQSPAEGLLSLTKSMVTLYQEELRRNADRVVHCRNAFEIDGAVKAGKAAALLSVEGAELLECDPQNLELAGQWGVKLINPTWNRANILSGSHCEDSDRGLSDAGRCFVREAERIGILMDVSHLSERGFWDLMEMTELPVVASHSNSRKIYPHSRGLSDDQFRAIVQSGGVAGLNFYSEFVGKPATVDGMVRHVEHWLEIGGENVVALGADLDGCDSLPQGIAGIQNVPCLWTALSERGYSDSLLKKLFWDNWYRLM